VAAIRVTVIATLPNHRRRIRWKNPLPEPSANQIQEALTFSRFRFKLIEFLKLPFDIGEPALREVLERAACGAYRNYLARAQRVEDILKSEDTLEMSIRTPPFTNHRADTARESASTR
jgi:hypothetical protein